jgi:hypothetical protein
MSAELMWQVHPFLPFLSCSLFYSDDKYQIKAQDDLALDMGFVDLEERECIFL